MSDQNPSQILDMSAWKAAADQMNPREVIEHIEAIIDHWRKNNAAAVVDAWEGAFKHYEGALPDDLTHHFAAIQATLAKCGQPIANPIKVPIIREVDENGIGPDGEEYIYKAAPEFAKRGLAFDFPVLLRYPDRHLEEGNEVRFTETAVKMLEADLKASVLPEDQWRQH